ncbi:hypothetical protein D3C87_104760 [compost metagenome]
MKKNWSVLLVIFAVALILYGGYMISKNSSSSEVSAPEEVFVESSDHEVPEPSSVGEAAPSEAAKPPVRSEDMGNRSEQFAQAMQEMAVCLNVRPPALEEGADVSLINVQDSLSEDFGGVIFQEDEWVTTDLRLPTGEVRRLFIQSAIGDGDQLERRLKYYAVDSQGQLSELPLEEEQRVNPSEALLASLEADGEISSRSSSKKLFMQNGAEMHVAESQGQVYSFEVIFEGKTFRCNELSNCRCF